MNNSIIIDFLRVPHTRSFARLLGIFLASSSIIYDNANDMQYASTLSEHSKSSRRRSLSHLISSPLISLFFHILLSRPVFRKQGRIHGRQMRTPRHILTRPLPRHPLPSPLHHFLSLSLIITCTQRSRKSNTRVFANSKETSYGRIDGRRDGRTDGQTLI